MITKWIALFRLFRRGAVVSDPALWKSRQITVTAVAGVLLAVVEALRAFGFDWPVAAADVEIIAAGVIAVVNVVLTVTTSDKVGLPAKNNNDDSLNHPDDPVTRVDYRG